MTLAIMIAIMNYDVTRLFLRILYNLINMLNNLYEYGNRRRASYRLDILQSENLPVAK